ncbi:hypothetical protein AB5I41_00665 [Sphingomonas sp. MMS24-JH45]
MIVAAYFSWRFVEEPFRNRKRVSNRWIILGSIAGLVAFAALGIVTFAMKGFPSRFPNSGKRLPMTNCTAQGEDLLYEKGL